ncbi:hypothetical protein yc1106_04876 [Curvularia clavata]|uniref:Uncharacterized protein n=1 Tax=Curvularia clavata TaxID=95742 RepID=A0A9Q9DSD9_CURCL|nr:hypothetical protein yc1106_04876 [Curvularia clavata]
MPSDDTLFQASLEDCIRGIKNFPVDRYPSVSSSSTASLRIGSQQYTPSAAEAGPSIAIEVCSTYPCPSPLSPSRSDTCKQSSSPPLFQQLAVMDRSRYANKSLVSPGGLTSPASLKASSRAPKLAVQPTENPGTLKLKKCAVKMVGTVEPKGTSLPVVFDVKAAQSPKDNVRPTDTDALGELFTRLNMKTSALCTVAMKTGSEPDQSKGITSAEGRPDSSKTKLTGPTIAGEAIPKHAFAHKQDLEESSQGKGEAISPTQAELEDEYICKAASYIAALPDTVGGTPQLVKVVSRKLRQTYAPAVDIDQKSADAIKARFAFAIATYINKVLGKGPKTRTPESIKETLKDVDGDFLKFCSILVDEKYISLETLDDVAGLVKYMLDILPKAEPAVQKSKPESIQSVSNIKEWPAQTRRENRAGNRTCILKGVAAVTNINKLQALVWGGKLESISMPEPGSSTAIVKFLTADGCKKYYEETMNGIEAVGDYQKFVVFVELAEGPNSTNDVIQSCIDRDITRCVRATGDVQFTGAQLMDIARGRGQSNKREVDCIKQAKNSRGYNYVEFRFASIYHALNFKRELLDDEDWEHCNIVSAPDPCELATGVHYED